MKFVNTMIQNRNDLKMYMAEDTLINLGVKKLTIMQYIKYWFYGNESFRVVRLLRALRHHEYYTNLCKSKKSIFNNVLLRYYTFKHHRLELKLDIKLGVNVLGYGVYIPHVGGGIIADCRGIGNYCKLNNGVVIGRNRTIDNSPLIGDNVDICVGSKIVRKVKIGNNVIIAPNTVVIDDIPDNCMASGVPAKIIKFYNQENSTNQH